VAKVREATTLRSCVGVSIATIAAIASIYAICLKRRYNKR
jgi:hypothetical protein